jgi:hypothetical protein
VGGEGAKVTRVHLLGLDAVHFPLVADGRVLVLELLATDAAQELLGDLHDDGALALPNPSTLWTQGHARQAALAVCTQVFAQRHDAAQHQPTLQALVEALVRHLVLQNTSHWQHAHYKGIPPYYLQGNSSHTISLTHAIWQRSHYRGTAPYYFLNTSNWQQAHYNRIALYYVYHLKTFHGLRY